MLKLKNAYNKAIEVFDENDFGKFQSKGGKLFGIDLFLVFKIIEKKI